MRLTLLVIGNVALAFVSIGATLSIGWDLLGLGAGLVLLTVLNLIAFRTGRSLPKSESFFFGLSLASASLCAATLLYLFASVAHPWELLDFWFWALASPFLAIALFSGFGGACLHGLNTQAKRENLA